MNKYGQTAYRTMRDSPNSEVDLLLAIASLFYLYGKLHKALAVLAVAEHLKPDAASVLELRTIVFCEMRLYEKVLETIARLETPTRPLAQELNTIKKRATHALESAS